MENILPKFFISLGVIFIILGLFTSTLSKIKIPMLPGDILIKRDNFIFYFPITTSIVLSIILTLLLSLFLRK